MMLAALADDWGSQGLTWSNNQLDVLYGLNASNDRLYTFDPATGAELAQVQLTRDYEAVGIEFHPGALRYYREIGIWPETGAAASGH